MGEFNDIARRFGLDVTGPRSRDYSRKMVWAPDRQRAIFCGANHGKPHRLNDVWEFDLAAMTWVLLYAPDNPRSYAGLGRDASDVVFRNGVLMTQRGGPAVVGHTWSGLTYDPAQRCMLFMNIWPINVDPLVSEVGGDPAERYRGPPLWRFDPESRSWSLVKTPPPWPKEALGAMLEHVPELGGTVWHLNNWQLSATWLLDAEAGRWSVIAHRSSSLGFADEAPGRELVGYHDPHHRRLVVQWKNDSFHFDTSARRWRRVASGEGPRGHDAFSSLFKNPVDNGGLLIDYPTRSIWTCDAERMQWRREEPRGTPMPDGPRLLAFADPNLRVLVVLDDADVWVYRPQDRRSN